MNILILPPESDSNQKALGVLQMSFVPGIDLELNERTDHVYVAIRGISFRREMHGFPIKFEPKDHGFSPVLSSVSGYKIPLPEGSHGIIVSDEQLKGMKLLS